MTAEIKKLSLVKFGRFKGFEMDVKGGLNVIYGPNEAGKSTINLFIKVMLYGMPVRKKIGESIKEREQAIPWGEKNAEGILTVCKDGRMIEIRRLFGATSRGDKLEICDASSGERIEGLNEESIGEWLFGVSQTVFEKTLWIRQSGAFMGGRDDELLKKITNLADAGDESVSAKVAIDKFLDMRKKIRAKDKRSAAGRLDELEKRLSECVKERYELATKLTQEEATSVRRQEAEAELLKVNIEIDRLDSGLAESREYEKSLSEIEVYKRICDCDTKLAEIYDADEYKKGIRLTDEIIEKAQVAQDRIDRLGKELEYEKSEVIADNVTKSKATPVFLSGIGAMLVILGVVGAIIGAINSKNIIAAALSAVMVIGVLIVLWSIRSIKVCNTLESEAEVKKAAELKKRGEIETEIRELSDDLGKLLADFEVIDVTALKRLYISVQALVERAAGLKALKDDLSSKYDLESLRSNAERFSNKQLESASDLDARLKIMRQKQLELSTEVKGLESKMAYQTSEHRIPADIDTEINKIKEDIKACERRLAVIDMAVKNIEEAANEWKTMITPEINKGVNEVMTFLTDGKYKEVRVSDEFKMRVVTDSDLYDAEYFSRGTYEQLYFALRVALAKNCGSTNPIFLDDILTVYDDSRAEAALRYLSDKDRGSVFLFTCHRAIIETARNLNAHIIII